MNFELNEQQLSIQKMAREFTEKKVAPKVLERDETRVYDVELYQELSRMGFIGLPYAKEYGGQGLGYLEYAIAIEEISKVDPSLSVSFSVATSLYGGSLYFSEATDEQLKRFMPPVIRDGHLGSFGLTEPTAGSDVSGMLTFAERKGDEYIINGSKCFITNGPLSDYFCVYALTDHELGPKSMATFVVEKNTPGFSIGARHNTMGIRSAMVSELHFNDVHVPVANMVTPPGKGFAAAMKTLDGGRIGIASQALGIAEGAFEIARKYLMQREQFKKPLYKNQHLAFRMVDLANEIEMAKYMVYKAACDKDDHKPFSASAAKAKLIAAETAMHVTTDAVQMLGGNGFMKEYHVERLMRDAGCQDHPDLRGYQRDPENRAVQEAVCVIPRSFPNLHSILPPALWAGGFFCGEMQPTVVGMTGKGPPRCTSGDPSPSRMVLRKPIRHPCSVI